MWLLSLGVVKDRPKEKINLFRAGFYDTDYGYDEFQDRIGFVVECGGNGPAKA